MNEVLVILALVALNGFFVATEFALVSVRKSRIDELLAQGRRRAQHVKDAVDDLDRYIAGTQVGITLASLGLGWLGEPMVARTLDPLFHRLPFIHSSEAMLHSVSFGVAFLLITVLHVVLGELVPKSVALQKPEAVALTVARPMSWIVVLLHPLIWSLNGIGNAVLRLMRIAPAGVHHNVHSVEELEILVRQSHEAGVFHDTEREILQRTFRFAELTARDVMVRRIDIIALDMEKSTEALMDEAAENIHSRLPAFVGSLDHIIGILHIHDLFKSYYKGTLPDDLRKLCRPAPAVPESIHLDDLLDFFKKQHSQIAIVVDEYGGTAGLVTFEDIVEEVTGEIQDELEAEEPPVQHLTDGRIVLRGDMRIDEVNEALQWELRDEHVDTLAGFIMNRLGRVARVDDEVDTSYGTLKVIDMARMRITKVSAVPKLDQAANES